MFKLKKSLLPLLFLIAFNAYAQDSTTTDTQEVQVVVNQFFEALEKKDSTIMKNAVMANAQISSISLMERPYRIRTRFIEDDILRLDAMPVVKEVATDYEIKVHESIAVAWVPYEFFVNNAFSHCGIDVFTLFKIDDSWKIMSLAYTTETTNCDILKESN
jgi:hypothetical protein